MLALVAWPKPPCSGPVPTGVSPGTQHLLPAEHVPTAAPRAHPRAGFEAWGTRLLCFEPLAAGAVGDHNPSVWDKPSKRTEMSLATTIPLLLSSPSALGLCHVPLLEELQPRRCCRGRTRSCCRHLALFFQHLAMFLPRDLFMDRD